MHPELLPADPLCAHWLAQVTLRLRREMAWCWQQRGGGGNAAAPPSAGALPPPGDAAQDSLDLLRFRDERRAFFAHDVSAHYLSERIAVPEPAHPRSSRRGDWAWIVQACALTPAAQFVLACALAARADAAIGAVCAACLNDASRPWPTLALAQRLWHEPLAITACADAQHALYRHGLITLQQGRDALDWQQPLDMPALVAQTLLDANSAPEGLLRATTLGAPATADAAPLQALLARLRSDPPRRLQLLPLQAPRGSDFLACAQTLAQACGHGLLVLDDAATPTRGGLAALATTAWLHGADVLLPEHWQEQTHERCTAGGHEHWVDAVAALPLRWYLPVSDGASAARSLSSTLPAGLLLPAFTLPALDTAARSRLLAGALSRASGEVRAAVPEAARRFRLTDKPLRRAAAAVAALGSAANGHDLQAVLRAEARVELEGLANAVTPRFALNELVLPPAQAQQLREIVLAMRALGRVHSEWGTARAWNECGLSVLFCGPPGTGKTMAAEALAHELALPMVRIDLSQVVNKYIGETEKNLRRIFDAAEISDCLMFFDEADALFGKRTEVRDAHDRYANIEVSYLLERMERFKGLAVLASNRRKDLDEAFTRRLRSIVEFPLPGVAEREQLWRQAFAPQVDTRALDCAWLAQQFELAGGHIRSAAFNACLLTAGADADAQPSVAMAQVLIAVKRELEKMNRVAGREQFGRYADALGNAA